MHRGEGILSPGLGWEGTQGPKGRETGTKPVNKSPHPPSPCPELKLWAKFRPLTTGLEEDGQKDGGHKDVWRLLGWNVCGQASGPNQESGERLWMAGYFGPCV